MPRKTETYVLERGGTLLAGRYRVIELLGVGAMGSVWIAEHLALKRKVVVKFHEEAFVGAGAHAALERFLREARTLASVRHKNVNELYEVGRTEDGEPYLILELLEGETLAQRLGRDEPVALHEALSIAIAVCFGLEAVHAAGILHRDVKPENIFLHEREREVIPKLLDFGLARRVASKGRISSSGRAIGTPGYMAPEQVRGAVELDQRADLYALGITLYEMLTGELPFAGATMTDLMIASTTDEPTPPSVWRAELRGPVEDLVVRSTAREREDRFPDARSMRLALSVLIEDLESTGAVTARARVARPPRAATPARRPPPPSSPKMARTRTAERSSSKPPGGR